MLDSILWSRRLVAAGWVDQRLSGGQRSTLLGYPFLFALLLLLQHYYYFEFPDL